jgi:hypothetical protein
MKKIAFTPDDLADVYVKRWMCRDMINSFLRNLRPVKLPGVCRPKFRRTVAFAIPESLTKWEQNED